MSARGGRSGATRLFALFAVASLVPTLVLVVVLGGSLRRDALSRTLSDARTQGQALAQDLVAPTVADDGLESGLDLGSATDLAAAVAAATLEGSVLRVHLHALTGQLVHPLGTPTGAPDPVENLTPDEATQVRDGRTLASVRDMGATERSTAGDVIRVLTPVLEPSEDRLVGVLEVWLPYDAVARSVTAQSQRMTVLLTLGLLVQYLVVAAISWLVTRRLRRQSTMYEHLANHDTLTDLPNRKLFRAQLAECVDQARRSGGSCSVAIVDLDRFKEVNDSLGHHVGDELLRQVSARMQQALRTDDRIARLGGDEFGIVLPGTDDQAAVRVL
ncbi:MAG TPA: GGDEF domain-containing protein, partial [Actinomycetales bacterium]